MDMSVDLCMDGSPYQFQGVAELSLPIFLPILNNLVILTQHNVTSKMIAELDGLCVFCEKEC